jgi:hypothetical protein
MVQKNSNLTDILVNAETLAAVFRENRWMLVDSDKMRRKYGLPDPEPTYPLAIGKAILAAIPEDPRLDALLAAAIDHICIDDDCELRDALAAFEEADDDTLNAYSYITRRR